MSTVQNFLVNLRVLSHVTSGQKISVWSNHMYIDQPGLWTTVKRTFGRDKRTDNINFLKQQFDVMFVLLEGSSLSDLERKQLLDGIRSSVSGLNGLIGTYDGDTKNQSELETLRDNIVAKLPKEPNQSVEVPIETFTKQSPTNAIAIVPTSTASAFVKQPGQSSNDHEQFHSIGNTFVPPDRDDSADGASL